MKLRLNPDTRHGLQGNVWCAPLQKWCQGGVPRDIGAHDYMRECDVVADLVPGDTSMKIQPEYYTDNNPGTRYCGINWPRSREQAGEDGRRDSI